MQYLVLIMVKLPEQMALERERFEQIVSRCEKLLGEVHEFVDEATRQIDQRLAQVSVDTGNKRQSDELMAVVRQDYRWSLFVLPVLCLLIGIGLSVWYERWIGAVAR